jgi:hypothetical protein
VTPIKADDLNETIGGRCALWGIGNQADEETRMAKYQNKEVKIVRPAKQGDAGFVATSGEQVVIKGDDGKEIAVPKAQVQDNE